MNKFVEVNQTLYIKVQIKYFKIFCINAIRDQSSRRTFDSDHIDNLIPTWDPSLAGVTIIYFPPWLSDFNDPFFQKIDSANQVASSKGDSEKSFI